LRYLGYNGASRLVLLSSKIHNYEKSMASQFWISNSNHILDYYSDLWVFNSWILSYSELGEIGTKTQHLFTIGLVLSSIFSIFFNIGLFRICKIIGLNIIPVLILWTFSFSILCAGLFSYPHWLHGLLGSPSIILFLSPMTALIFWKTNMISNIKIISLLTLLIMSLGFLIFSPNILTDYFGIKQRFFHLGWTVWFLCLTFIFIGINKRLKING
jgi:hypothetical protein